MQHYRNPDTRAEIRRAGRQVAVTRTEGIVNLLFYQIVDAVYLLGTLRQLAAGHEDLDSQMVLLVDHSGEEFLLCHYSPPRAFAERVVAADKVTLYKEIPVQ